LTCHSAISLSPKKTPLPISQYILKQFRCPLPVFGYLTSFQIRVQVPPFTSFSGVASPNDNNNNNNRQSHYPTIHLIRPTYTIYQHIPYIRHKHLYPTYNRHIYPTCKYITDIYPTLHFFMNLPIFSSMFNFRLYSFRFHSFITSHISSVAYSRYADLLGGPTGYRGVIENLFKEKGRNLTSSHLRVDQWPSTVDDRCRQAVTPPHNSQRN
jgi:hypothetical protein